MTAKRSLGWARPAAVFVTAVTLACGGGAAPARKVLLIGLDGVRVDVMAQAVTPQLDSLAGQGIFTDRARTGDPTVSGPGWSSMLTGVWPDKHGVHGNEFSDNRYAEYPDFLTRLERIDSTFGTYAVIDWPPLGTTADGGPLISAAVDLLDVVDGEVLGYRVADSLSVVDALRALERPDLDAAFVYLGDIDVVGHEFGSLSPEYRTSIEWADARVGELLAALRRRPTYSREDWLVLISTDHGRTDAGGHGGVSLAEHTIFFLASGPSVQVDAPLADVGVVDVAVTALAHLGVAIDPAWGLDGRAVGLAGGK
jgi:predicted AlkP superfamily pyrophosphatase or phosphodiesterase